MATPRREIIRMPDLPRRRRSARQALAMIPGSTTTNTTPDIATEPTPRNPSSRQSVGSPGPSPDELVIQSRGRRKTIVWSPEKDPTRNSNLFRDRTPVKSPSKNHLGMTLRSTPKTSPRKRLLLDSTDLISGSPKTNNENKLSNLSSFKHCGGNIANGLRGLSHEQLVKIIMNLITMQEDNLLNSNDSLKDIILRNMPVADIQPLKEKLLVLRTNIYASMVPSNFDESSYDRAYDHLKNFWKVLKEQGQNLLDSQHWSAVMQYFFTAWIITKDIPDWKNQEMSSTVQNCYKELTQLCLQALKNGKFVPSTLSTYKEKLRLMVEDYSDVNLCLQLINDTRVS